MSCFVKIIAEVTLNISRAILKANTLPMAQYFASDLDDDPKQQLPAVNPTYRKCQQNGLPIHEQCYCKWRKSWVPWSSSQSKHVIFDTPAPSRESPSLTLVVLIFSLKVPVTTQIHNTQSLWIWPLFQHTSPRHLWLRKFR